MRTLWQKWKDHFNSQLILLKHNKFANLKPAACLNSLFFLLWRCCDIGRWLSWPGCEVTSPDREGRYRSLDVVDKGTYTNPQQEPQGYRHACHGSLETRGKTGVSGSGRGEGGGKDRERKCWSVCSSLSLE